MGRLQIPVGLLLGVTAAVLAEGVHLIALVPAYPALLPRRVFVEIVAQAEHHVEILLRQVLVRGEPSLLEARAGGDAEGDRVQRSGRRCGARAADGGDLSAHPEPVPVRRPGSEPSHVDVDAVRLLGQRLDGPALQNGLEGIVRRDLPFDVHRALRHPAVLEQRFGGEAGPQHDRVRQGVTGGDSEGERLGDPAGGEREDRGGDGDARTEGGTADEQGATVRAKESGTRHRCSRSGTGLVIEGPDHRRSAPTCRSREGTWPCGEHFRNGASRVPRRRGHFSWRKPILIVTCQSAT